MFRKLSQALKAMSDRNILWAYVTTHNHGKFDTKMYYLANGVMVAQMDVYDTHVVLYNY